MKYEKRDNIPNYEKRPEPLPYQLPLSAAESMKYTQVPIGWELQLFAAEPQIVNPIYMQWDARGRLWVAESIDYPNEIKAGRKGNDRIKILEDTNGDGKCDKVEIFANGPTLQYWGQHFPVLATLDCRNGDCQFFQCPECGDRIEATISKNSIVKAQRAGN